MFSQVLRQTTLTLSLLALISSTGCARKVILHPITDQDIFRIKQEAIVNNQAVQKDGWFISDMYLKEVVQARVEQ